MTQKSWFLRMPNKLSVIYKYLHLFIFTISFLIYFFSWLFFYKTGINSLPMQSEDILPSVFTSISIIKDGTIYVDNYYQMMISKYPQPDDSSLTHFYLRKIGENYITAFPLMSSVISLPITYFYLLFDSSVSWESVYFISHLSGSFIVALSSALVFYIFYNLLKSSLKKSLLLTFIFSFCTINLPLISQGLWQHGTVQLFGLLAVIFYLKNNPFLLYLSVGLGVLSRPTFGLVLVILSIFLLINKRKIIYPDFDFKYWGLAFVGLIIPVVFFFFYNQVFYQSLSNQGYASQLDDSWQGNFPESFIGMFLSPSKGILIYSPILIFSLIGFYYGYKKHELVKISFWIVLIHCLVLSKWKHWYGGYGYGYRMVSDVIPFFIFPIWFMLETHFEKIKKIVFGLILLSFLIQFSGLIFFDSIWHNAYDTGFKNTSWLWSIENSEAVFNIRRVLVKLGFLDKACEVCLPEN